MGLIEADESFHGSDYASGSFIASTAIRSVGDARIRLSLGINQKLKDEDYISIALENGLIQEEQLKRGLTADETEVIIEKLVTVQKVVSARCFWHVFCQKPEAYKAKCHHRR